MRAVVAYESMYGNTRKVADAIAKGLRESGEASVVSIPEATAEVVAAADLLVVGGPTHVHGLSRQSTREAAVQAADKEGSVLHLEPEVQGDRVREWLVGLAPGSGRAAAFDTRIRINPLLSGRASKRIARALRRHGFELIAPAESFLVTNESVLVEGEEDRAVEWGRSLGKVLAPVRVGGS